MSKFGQKFLWITLLTLPTMVTMYWSIGPAAKALTAMLLLNPEKLSRNADIGVQEQVDLRRKIQKHFLGFGLYLPLEDIIVGMGQAQEDRVNFLSVQACGNGNIFVWIPFRFRLPIIGDKVVEHCWRKNIRKGWVDS